MRAAKLTALCLCQTQSNQEGERIRRTVSETSRSSPVSHAGRLSKLAVLKGGRVMLFPSERSGRSERALGVNDSGIPAG